MKLVIEREGGFSIVEDADAITEIDVMNHAVKLTIEVGGDTWTKELPVSSHAEACRVSAAIAVRCGELVELLSEAPSNGVEDAEDDDAMGAVMAGRIRKAPSEWVRGEPPRDGMTYVAREGVNSLCVRWDGERWMTGGMPVAFGAGVVHLPTALTMEGMARPVSEWVAGEPPKDGRWYVCDYGHEVLGVARWAGDWFNSDGDEVLTPVAHLATPIPNR